MKKVYQLIIVFVIATACAQVRHLNMTRHNYFETAGQIIWIQVPGLDEEQLALLRFTFSDLSVKTSFEEASCMGHTWAFNALALRPTVRVSLQTQITGVKNIKGTCGDYKIQPFWNNLGKTRAAVGIIENEAPEKDSLDEMLDCQDVDRSYVDLMTVWAMKKTKREEASFFHYQGNLDLKPGFYFDKSCQQGSCASNLIDNTKFVFQGFVKSKFGKVFIVRDFSVSNALKQKKILVARERLLELDKIHRYFLEYQQKNPNVLLLVTGSNPMPVELPKEGKDWAEFDRTGKNIFYRSTGLLSPLFASGAGAENFCGILEDSEIISRIDGPPKFYKLKLNLF